MAAPYLTFLLDLAGEGKSRAIPNTIRFERDPGTQPRNMFVWKVTHDGEGKILVEGMYQRHLGLLGVARWAEGELADVRQQHATIPSGFQWSLVEASVAVELERSARRVPAEEPGPVEDVRSAARTFQDRPRDWDRYEGASYGGTGGSPGRRAGDARYTTTATRWRRYAWIGAGVALVVVVALWILLAAEGPADAPVTSTRPVPARPAGPAPAPPVVESPEVRIAALETFEEAIALARPEMTDTTAELGPGARLLAHHASRKLRWADVDVPAETTIGHVLKDPAIERGKRMCAEGELSRIERRDLGPRKIYVGELRTGEGDAVRFVAVGTTGDLVKRSRGRLCGAVLGRAGEAVSMLGMFDLPENRDPIVEQ